MSPTTRSRMLRSLGALLGAAALAAALPAPALAKDRDRGHRRHRHDRDCDHDHRKSHRHERVRYPAYFAPHFVPAPPHWQGAYRHHAPAYYCGRCRTHFGSYDRLYGHVHHHHRVPVVYVPGLLAQVSFGFAFGL